MGILQRGKIFLSADRNSYIHRSDAGKAVIVIDGVEVMSQGTPVASVSQAAVTVTAVADIAATVFSAAFTGMWAFSSSTVAKTYRTVINQLRADVVALSTGYNAMRTALIANKAIKGSA